MSNASDIVTHPLKPKLAPTSPGPGKGDKRRSSSISDEEYKRRWDKIFRKENPDEHHSDNYD